MAWVKIGEAYTDNNGIATLPYTGTGRGVVRGMAKSTVDERMIQSETYGVIDATFNDMVNSVDNASALVYNQCSKTVNGDVKTITANGSGWGDLILSTTHAWADIINFNIPFCIEINITDLSNDFIFRIGGKYTDWLTQTGQYKLNVSPTGITGTVNGVAINPKTFDSALSTAQIYISTKPNQTFSYKDLIVYPI